LLGFTFQKFKLALCEELRIVGDLPGVCIDDVNVIIDSSDEEGTILVVQAVRKMPPEVAVVCLERSYGSVENK
jgi:HSP20 family molecular chaperone IbpA